MQPIKTTNAMNPAPAKGIESFPTPVIDDVVISEGGMVGVGLYPKEFDKVQVVDCIRDEYDEIHYFGDKYETDGNDYHLLHHALVIGHKVDSVEDTLHELEKL